MNPHDSTHHGNSQQDKDDDWLDQLYARSATEQPPPDLDQRILAAARQHHPSAQASSVFKWQRLVSFAAVLVLTIGVFFEVDRSFEVDEFHAPARDVAPVGSTNQDSGTTAIFAEPPAELNQAEHARSAEARYETAKQEAKQQAQVEIQAARETEQRAKTLADEKLTLAAPEPPLEARPQQNKSRSMAPQSFDALSEKDADNPAKKKDHAELADESAIVLEPLAPETQSAPAVEEPNAAVSAEELIQEIERLLAEGDQDQARERYFKLKQAFPDYPVPEIIQQTFGYK